MVSWTEFIVAFTIGEESNIFHTFKWSLWLLPPNVTNLDQACYSLGSRAIISHLKQNPLVHVRLEKSKYILQKPDMHNWWELSGLIWNRRSSIHTWWVSHKGGRQKRHCQFISGSQYAILIQCDILHVNSEKLQHNEWLCKSNHRAWWPHDMTWFLLQSFLRQSPWCEKLSSW